MEISKKILGGLFIVWMMTGLLGAGVELQLSYGTWTLEPFSPLVEKKSAEMIDEGIRYSLGYFQYLYNEDQAVTDFAGSSGHYLSGTLWFALDSRWSLGVKGEYLALNLPFAFTSTQQVNIPFVGPAHIAAQGNGQAEIRSLIVSILGRLQLLHKGKVKMSAYAGLSLLPFKGTFYMNGEAQVDFAGDQFPEYLQVPEQSLKEIRDLYGVPPKQILTPTLGLSVQYFLFKKAGLLLDLAFSQGTLLSAGLFLQL